MEEITTSTNAPFGTFTVTADQPVTITWKIGGELTAEDEQYLLEKVE